MTENGHLVKRWLHVVAAVVVVSLPASAYAEPLFAVVEGTEITRQEFEREVYKAARQTYYHGQPPSQAEFQSFRHDVANSLVDKMLLLAEAKRRGIKADTAAIDKKLAAYEKRYGNTARWQSDGEKMLVELRHSLNQDDLVRQLEEQIRSGEPPEESDLQKYYRDFPEKFTQPRRDRVSLILLAVDPSSTADVWQSRRREAADLLAKLKDGASFEDLARLYSDDHTSRLGGDMGYQHEGMLSAAAQEALDRLSVGEVTEPVTVLEGLAIFKLTDRQPAALQQYGSVKSRVSELWLRDRGEQRWQAELERLRAKSEIDIDFDYLSQTAVPR